MNLQSLLALNCDSRHDDGMGEMNQAFKIRLLISYLYVSEISQSNKQIFVVSFTANEFIDGFWIERKSFFVLDWMPMKYVIFGCYVCMSVKPNLQRNESCTARQSKVFFDVLDSSKGSHLTDNALHSMIYLR